MFPQFRSRQLALKALNERLSKSDQPAASWPSMEDSQDSPTANTPVKVNLVKKLLYAKTIS